jgi:thymidine phosphorylase
LPPGAFFFVVGASGVGKDTLIAGAMQALAPTGRYVQARRAITRPEGPGEDHEPVSPADFAAREAAGGFLLTWDAHGLRYGLPAALLDQQARGLHIVVSGSRAALPQLVGRVPRLVVVEVTAPAAALRDRIVARGRETAAAVEERLSRQVPPLPDGLPIIRVHNDATVQDGVARLIAAIESVG